MSPTRSRRGPPWRSVSPSSRRASSSFASRWASCPAEASLEAPRWVGACAGLMFALCGAAVIVGYAVAGGVGPDGDLPAGTPRWVRLTQYLLGLGIISALAAIATWIAFGPGPRAFTVTLPFVGRGPGNEIVGRVVFGSGAVLMWVFLVVFLVVSVKRLRRK